MCIFAQIFFGYIMFLSNLRRNSRKDREQSIFQSLNIHFLYKKLYTLMLLLATVTVSFTASAKSFTLVVDDASRL